MANQRGSVTRVGMPKLNGDNMDWHGAITTVLGSSWMTRSAVILSRGQKPIVTYSVMSQVDWLENIYRHQAFLAEEQCVSPTGVTAAKKGKR